MLFRILPNFGIQGGDVTSDNGLGGRSVYGRFFDDESFELPHRFGSLTMANSGPNTNNSQFLVITREDGAPWLDGKHVVFGHVLCGFDVLKRIEACGQKNGTPTDRLVVVDCGEISERDASVLECR